MPRLSSNLFLRKDILNAFGWRKSKGQKFSIFVGYNFRRKMEALKQANEITDEHYYSTMSFRDEILIFFRRKYRLYEKSPISRKRKIWQKFQRDSMNDAKLMDLKRLQSRLANSLSAKCRRYEKLLADLLVFLYVNPDRLIYMYQESDNNFHKCVFRDALFFYYEKYIVYLHNRSKLGKKSRVQRTYKEHAGKLFTAFTCALETFDSQKGKFTYWLATSFYWDCKTEFEKAVEEDNTLVRLDPTFGYGDACKDDQVDKYLTKISIEKSDEARREDWKKAMFYRVEKKIQNLHEHARTKREKQYYSNVLNYFYYVTGKRGGSKKEYTDREISKILKISDRTIRFYKKELTALNISPLFLMKVDPMAPVDMHILIEPYFQGIEEEKLLFDLDHCDPIYPVQVVKRAN